MDLFLDLLVLVLCAHWLLMELILTMDGCCIMFSVEEEYSMVEFLHSLKLYLRNLKEWLYHFLLNPRDTLKHFPVLF